MLQWVHTATTRKKSDIYAKEYETTINNPTLLKAEKAKNAELRTKWQNPYLHPELRQELQDAYKKADLAGWAAAEQRAKQNTPDTPATSKLFTRLTGIKLPGTIVGNQRAIKEWAPQAYQNYLDNNKQDGATFSIKVSRETIKKATANQLKSKERIELCTLPRVLSYLGENAPGIYTRAETLHKLAHKHNLSDEEIENIIKSLDDPLLVIRESATSYIFYLPIEAKNKEGNMAPVMAALRMQKDDESGHYLMSAYPLKSTQKIEERIRKGDTVYSKYNKAALSNSNAPSPFKPDLVRLLVNRGLTDNVITEEDIVNYKNTAEQKKVTTAIKAAAEKNGTFMKAPNGKPTKLTERQWLQVRTQAFKNWFGDWENDPANASKVVDENGEPLVVYHGTPTGGFTIFREEPYFTPHKRYAERYRHPSASSNRSSRDVGTPMLYEAFLNIRKPFDTRNNTEREIFQTEFYRKWGNGAPLSERGLPDWTDATDIETVDNIKGTTDTLAATRVPNTGQQGGVPNTRIQNLKEFVNHFVQKNIESNYSIISDHLQTWERDPQAELGELGRFGTNIAGKLQTIGEDTYDTRVTTTFCEDNSIAAAFTRFFSKYNLNEVQGKIPTSS